MQNVKCMTHDVGYIIKNVLNFMDNIKVSLFESSIGSAIYEIT